MRDYPYILVAFLEKFEEGFEFERWPHHITILPWFKADKKALASLEQIAENSLPLPAELTGTAMFGHGGDILVRLVASKQLDELHHSLLRERQGLLGLVNSRHTKESFSPHITLQGQNDPAVGELQIKYISLVKKVKPDKTKRIVKNYKNSR